MNDNSLIKLDDKLIIDDNFKGTIISGRMVIEDSFGNVILDKHNLVVLQGRGFILRKLFAHSKEDVLDGNKTVSGSGNTDIACNVNTLPILFTVGFGGTSSIENPTAYTPKYDDKTIASSFATGTDIVTDGTTKGKRFSKIEYKNDSDTNETYVCLTLSLTREDFDLDTVPTINEAGILFGEASFTDHKVTGVKNLTLMTRITFDSIPINSSDGLTFKYYLYG